MGLALCPGVSYRSAQRDYCQREISSLEARSCSPSQSKAGSEMTREALVQKYKCLHEAAPEKSLEWYCYGEGYGFLGGKGSIDWAIKQLQKIRRRFLDAGAT